MGFGDLVGDAFDAVGDAGGAGLGLAMDLAKTYTASVEASVSGDSLGKRDDAYRHAAQNLQQSANRRRTDYLHAHATFAKSARAIGSATEGALTALNYPLDKVQRAASTWEILNSEEVAGPATGLGVSQLFSPSKWHEAYGLAENVSPGQALTRRSGQTPLGKAVGLDEKLGITGSTWQNIHRYGEQGDNRFSPQFSLASGTFDAAFSWAADPLVIGGHAARAVKAAKTETRAGDLAAMASDAPLKGRVAKVRNQFDSFIVDTDDKTPTELMKHSAFRDSPQGAALASLFAKASGDHETKRLLWRTAMGDAGAKEALAQRRTDLSFQVDRLQSNLDDLLKPRAKDYGLRQPSSQADIDAVKAEIESSKPTMDFLNRALGDDDALALADEMGTLVNKDDAGVFGAVSGRARVTRADSRRAAKTTQYTVQDGVAGIPVRVRRAPTQRRPEGWIDYHDAEQGFSEMDRMTQRVRGLDPVERNRWLDSYVNAPDDNARRLVKGHTERAMVAHIGAQLGYKPGEVQALMGKIEHERDTALSALREKSYAVLEDGTVLHDPIMETQLANSEPTLDVDHIYRVLKRNQETTAAMRAAHSAFDTSEAFLDIVNDVWKTSVLLRGGYVIRNVMDSQLRLIAHLGGLHALTLQAENAGRSIRRGISFGEGDLRIGDYVVGDAMGRTADSAKLTRKSMSSSDDWASFAVGESEKILNKVRGSGSWTTIHPETNPGQWLEAYLRVVNQHVRQSEITKRLLAGDSEAEVARWLKSPDGRALRRRLHADTPEELVAANASNLRHLVPDEMRSTLRDRALTHDDVDAMFPVVGSRPAVNAEQIQWSQGEGHAAEAYNKVKETWFRYANSLPDDVLGRHPMYVSLYRGRMRQLLHQADPTLEGSLSRADQVAMETHARAFARRQMKRYMFDVASKSNLGHFVRFLSPFFSAWEDVMVKYGRMIAEDPALVPQLWKTWTAPNNASFVEIVDSQTGKPVPASESGLNDNESIRMQVPFLEKYFSTGGVDISKASFNVVLQGDPVYLPGAGPMVQAPVNELALRTDNTTVAEAAQALGVLPYGVQNQGAAKFFLPTVARNAVLPEDQQKRMMAMIAMTEEARYRQGLRDTPPTQTEVAKRFRNLRDLRVFTAALSPVSVQYKSPYQFYIDQYHAYTEKYGPEKADKKFYDDMGEDLFLFGASMSNNRTGVAATKRADNAARKVKDLIADHPDYGWYFVGPDNVGEYDRNVYTLQTHRKVSPTGTDVYRDTYDNALDAIKNRNAEEGWLEYQKLSGRLDAMKIAGQATTSQIAAAKRAWIEINTTGENAKPWGHDWLNDYESRDSGYTRKFLEAARVATTDDRLKDRPDVAVMAEYLKYRDAIRQVLAQRGAAGGSHTLAGNDDVAAAWKAITDNLVEQNVTFGDTFARYLESDDLSAKA